MSLHDWLGTHAADTRGSHWEGGHFVTRCLVCGKVMVKLPGLPWRLKQAGTGHKGRRASGPRGQDASAAWAVSAAGRCRWAGPGGYRGRYC